MTKPKGQNPREDYDPFRDDGDTALVREEADERNDEALMTNDEGMTKPKTARDEFDETFWNDDAMPVVREEASENRVYDLEERTARFGEDDSILTAMRRSKPREAKCIRHSGFIILSSFGIRISSFSRV